jgi:hypothetical protein
MRDQSASFRIRGCARSVTSFPGDRVLNFAASPSFPSFLSVRALGSVARMLIFPSHVPDLSRVREALKRLSVHSFNAFLSPTLVLTGGSFFQHSKIDIHHSKFRLGVGQ